MGLPRVVIGPQGSNYFSSGSVLIVLSISKETFTHVSKC